jgi:hypothetical protein
MRRVPISGFCNNPHYLFLNFKDEIAMGWTGQKYNSVRYNRMNTDMLLSRVFWILPIKVWIAVNVDLLFLKSFWAFDIKIEFI